MESSEGYFLFSPTNGYFCLGLLLKPRMPCGLGREIGDWRFEMAIRLASGSGELPYLHREVHGFPEVFPAWL